MRIVHLITPRRFSGAERQCAQMCALLRRRGHEVLLVTKHLPVFETYLADHGVPFRAARVGNKFDFSRPLAIARLLREYRADLLHTHLSTAAQWGTIAACLADVPCVAHVHALNRAIWYVWAVRVIAVAGAVRDHLVAQGLPAERICVVPNAVECADLPEVDVTAKRASLGVPTDVPVVAVVAHLSRKKGLHVLLSALASLRLRLPGWHCLLVGEGPERGALEAQAQRLGLERVVSFLGFREDARDIMAAADIVCLPSVAGEGMPMVLLEAAARGRPVIATRLAGVGEAVVDGVTGLLATPDSVDELVDCLEKLLTNGELRQQMGQRARERVVREFNLEVYVTRLEEVYQVALEAKRSARRSRKPG